MLSVTPETTVAVVALVFCFLVGISLPSIRLCYAQTVPLALAAAAVLEEEEISAEVLDLRSIKPLDMVFRSGPRTLMPTGLRTPVVIISVRV